ncbi:hypothetical protein [Devosia sp. Root436]|uniref:hypothetical protein n=1 Tax=Devosia sp. Root436 TaxID=1736537 RepID=UPI000A487727|nr:hypothetical protein [Devosia sp. Root436]
MKFKIAGNVAAADCVANGYPDPDVNPWGWYEAVKLKVASQIQESALNLDDARRILEVALDRTLYRAPPTLPFAVPGTIEYEILEELAA